jgi:hypothetical protein
MLHDLTPETISPSTPSIDLCESCLGVVIRIASRDDDVYYKRFERSAQPSCHLCREILQNRPPALDHTATEMHTEIPMVVHRELSFMQTERALLYYAQLADPTRQGSNSYEFLRLAIWANEGKKTVSRILHIRF